jgi:hypothetical protein
VEEPGGSTPSDRGAAPNDQIVREARRIEESADFGAQVQFEAAKYWGTLGTCLSLIGAVAAFASGAAILQVEDLKTVASLLAFVAGSLGVVNLVIRASDKSSDCTRAGRAFRRARDEARVLANIDSARSPSTARERLATVVAQYNEADEHAPMVGWAFWAVRRARRNLKHGLTSFYVDDDETP